MQTYNIFTNHAEHLKQTKADLLLITSLGQNCSSFSELLQDETLLYSPLLITNAVANLSAFSEITFHKIEKKEEQDARDIFALGMAFGRAYELRGNALILGQYSQNAATNAEQILSLLEVNKEKSTFEILLACDVTLLFCAGFLLEASRRFHIIVGGGFEMAFVLYIADILRADLLMRPMSHNITYITSQNAKQTQPIEKLLMQLSYTPHALYTSIDLSAAEIEKLKNIGEEECGASGAALAFAQANAITNVQLLNEMELIVYIY